MKNTNAVVEQMLAEARDDVKHADQKASVILAALGIGFGVVLGGQLAGNFDSGTFSTCGQIFWWIGVVLASAAVASAGLAVWPRYKLDDSPTHGVTYWGHVAAFSDPTSLGHALRAQMKTVKVEDRTRHQLWQLSRLVLLKYRLVRAALVSGATAALLLALAAIVIK